MTKDNRRPIVGVRFPRPMLDQLQQIAEAQDRSPPDVVREAVRAFLAQSSSPAPLVVTSDPRESP
jgi:hypothetical protein